MAEDLARLVKLGIITEDRIVDATIRAEVHAILNPAL